MSEVTWQEIAHALWQLLDDVDTAGDAVKGNDAAYRRAVEQIHPRRLLFLESRDGHNLTPVVKLKEPSTSARNGCCKTCRWFDTSGRDAIGRCRIYPPRPESSWPSGLQWPPVRPNDWCGSHDLKEDEQPAALRGGPPCVGSGP